MSEILLPASFGHVIIIRYDGLDAERHEIDMALFTDSIHGLARIIGVAGNFAATEKVILQKNAFVIKAVISTPQSHCFEISVWLKWINENPLITTVVGGLVVTLAAYICKKAAGDREEMRHLRGALDIAIRELGHRDESVVDRLLATIDKMADSLRPSARQAVAPIGQTARTFTIKSRDSAVAGGTFDAADKEAILSESPIEVGQEGVYAVRFTEMDVETGSCKVALDPITTERVSAKITDPDFLVANNKYVLALAAQATIKVTAKPTIRDGEMEKLFISNTAE
jgi:hypothetical protein